MNTRLIKTTTEDKLTLQGLLYEPDGEARAVVLHIHGMAGNFYENAFLDVMAERYTDAGYAFLSVNTRGHDFFSEFAVAGNEEIYKRIGNAYERFEDCIIDIQTWMNWLGGNGFSSIVLQGHSLGAPKVAYYLAQNPDTAVEKLVLLSPADMVGLAEVETYHKDLYEEAQNLVASGMKSKLLSHKLWAEYYLSASTYLDFFTRGNPIDAFNLYSDEPSKTLLQITTPTFIAFGEKDDAVIGPVQDTIDKIVGKMSNCSAIDSAVISSGSHSYFKAEGELMDAILGWLDA